MKRILTGVLALCLCFTAACAGETREPEATAVPAEETAAPAEETTAPAEETAAAPETEDFTALDAEACVEDAGVLPRIVLDCPGAEEIDRRIEERYAPLAEDESCEGVGYTCYKGADRILTVLMWEEWPNDCVFYAPFLLDLATGQALDGAGLLALLGVDKTALADAETAVLGETFQEQFAAMKEFMDDTSFYDEQYARTTDPENADLERVWLDDEGQLCFVGRVYGLAGAEFYEYPLGTGMMF